MPGWLVGLLAGGLPGLVAVAAALWYRRDAAAARKSEKTALDVANGMARALDSANARAAQAEHGFLLERRERLAEGDRHRRALQVSAEELDDLRTRIERLVEARKDDPDVQAWARDDATRAGQLPGGARGRAATEPDPGGGGSARGAVRPAPAEPGADLAKRR